MVEKSRLQSSCGFAQVCHRCTEYFPSEVKECDSVLSTPVVSAPSPLFLLLIVRAPVWTVCPEESVLESDVAGGKMQ